MVIVELYLKEVSSVSLIGLVKDLSRSDRRKMVSVLAQHNFNCKLVKVCHNDVHHTRTLMYVVTKGK